MFKKTLVAGALLLGAAGVHAAEGNYFGVSLNSVELEQGGESVTVTALQAAVGTLLTPNLAVEGRVSLGVADDTEEGVKFEQGLGIGAYLKPFMSFNDFITGYGLVGYVHNNYEISASGISLYDDLNALSIGIGVEFETNADLTINVEYHTFSDDFNNGVSIPDIDVNTLSVGLKKAF